MKRLTLASAFFLGILFFSSIPPTSAVLTADFEFQLTTGEVVNISDYKGKPVLIEWAATWCSTCKKNQENLNLIYDTYKDNITFISISYGGSRDTLEDVKDMKSSRGYDWDFGLDINNYASEVKTANGYNWLLSADLKVLKTWNSTIVSAKAFADAFDEYLGIANVGVTNEDVVSSPLFLMTLLILPLLRRRK